MSDQTKMNDSHSILKSLKETFATMVYKVVINSSGEEATFKEATVKEQKTLSKILIQNKERKDIEYDTQCAMINNLALTEGFNIYDLTEFDRIKILMTIYQSNFTDNSVQFTCPECGTENKHVIDFEKIISVMDRFDLSDKTIDVSDNRYKYSFVINFPTVRRLSDFYKFATKSYRQTAAKGNTEAANDMIALDTLNLFIKKFDIIDKTTNSSIATVDCVDGFGNDFNELNEAISMFPQNVAFGKDGVVNKINSLLMEPLNSTFDTPKCLACGKEHSDMVGGVQDFF